MYLYSNTTCMHLYLKITTRNSKTSTEGENNINIYGIIHVETITSIYVHNNNTKILC